eukprot:668764-Amphidinium_carterae.1
MAALCCLREAMRPLMLAPRRLSSKQTIGTVSERMASLTRTWSLWQRGNADKACRVIALHVDPRPLHEQSMPSLALKQASHYLAANGSAGALLLLLWTAAVVVPERCSNLVL